MQTDSSSPPKFQGWKYKRHVPCAQAQYEDMKGICQEWERGLDDSRRPPWIEQRARFIQRRLTRPDYRAHIWLRHTHDLDLVIAEVPCHRAGISRRKVMSLFRYLRTWDSTMVDRWGEALLTSHLEDFMDGIGETQEWHHAVKASPHQKHCGLMLLHDPVRLVFAIYPKRVADAIKESLGKLALEA